MGTIKLPAAKLHVLGLLPLKLKLGSRWERLSALVQKLFETAISKVQGPSDQFIRLDELSYAVTFANLSLSETNLVCMAVARDVCQTLFGDGIDEVSVRNITAEICVPTIQDAASNGKRIELLLELCGTATVITQNAESKASGPVTGAERVFSPPRHGLDQIRAAHALLERVDLRLGLFPVWELKKDACSSVALMPFIGSADHIEESGKSSLFGLNAAQVAEVETSLLAAAAAYATRAHAANQLCAIIVGVCFNTLSSFSQRIAYLTALQKVQVAPTTPLMVKIEQVPQGVSLARVAELVAMIRATHIRAVVEFCSLDAMPEIDIRLGATGIGGAMTGNTSYEAVRVCAERLVRRASAQKVFSFMDRLDTHQHVAAARQSNVRFGTAIALGTRHLSGLEEVPSFPLSRETVG